jgi:hypothetical protein
VHVQVDVLASHEASMTAIAEANKGFEWLGDEPDLYSDADLESAG